MEFTSQNSKYTSLFMGHFKRFIEEYQLFDKETPLLVTVSGGIDSMAMMFALWNLRSYGYSNGVRVLNLNHGTRDGQNDEAALVAQFCEILGIEYIGKSLEGLNPNRNFEYHARLSRYESFYEVALPDEKIVLAHHLDDSFEWTMLQSLRSSSIEGLIGIPVVNGRVIRPFMCVSKQHIRNFVHYFDLPFIEDPTNELLKYERNFIRNEVVGAFKDRHPKYLKHYVYRHNEIARRLGAHLIFQDRGHFKMSYAQNSVLIYNLSHHTDYGGIGHLVLNAVKHISPNTRGSLNKQLIKIEQALSNNKVGPLNLVGNIKAYLDHNLVLITAESEKKLQPKFNDFKTFSHEEFVNYLSEYITSADQHLDFPFIVLVKNSNLDKRSFKISFNTDNLERFSTGSVAYYPALKLLRMWSRKQSRHKVLRLNMLSGV